MKVVSLISVFLVLVQAPLGETWFPKKCWTGKGHCRLLCKSDEIYFTRCSNRKRCCLPAEAETFPPMVIDEILLFPSPSPSIYEAQTITQPETSSSTSGP